MKSVILLSIIVSVIVLAHCTGSHQRNTGSLEDVKQHILSTNGRFDNQLQQVAMQINNNAADALVQKSFEELRHIYKQMEWAVAYFMPETARFTNGPALDEIEFEENVVLEAEGLQVLEESMYPTIDTTQKAELLRMLKKLSNKSQAINIFFEANSITPAQVMDALRLQVFRITTLGITGFDTPVSGTGLKEASWSLDALAIVLGKSKFG